ncbi:MAG: hypothetical protein Greene041619_307 [Candidatus Peregrinibacteria bacterium Greene0416_19]|nr:MAG: hypothetical protein Greene041619_307 [Candidatus Peregrinibacteria bacterium Greene0416_19]
MALFPSEDTILGYNASPMPVRPLSPFSILAEAWMFFRKQPALNAVLVAFLILPGWGINIFVRLSDPDDLLSVTTAGRFLARTDPYHIIPLVLSLVLLILYFWGMAGVLLVGKRMIQNRAGRSRSSFAAVRRGSARLVLPLLLTHLLRFCFGLYWGLLFIIPATILFFANRSIFLPLLLPLLLPAILYQIRTSLFTAALAAEGKAYREALRRSRDITRGHLLITVGNLFVIGAILFLAAGIVGALATGILGTIDPRFLVTADLVDVTAQSFAILLSSLATIELFGRLREAREGKVKEVVPVD